jgi:hypothetical protein
MTSSSKTTRHTDLNALVNASRAYSKTVFALSTKPPVIDSLTGFGPRLGLLVTAPGRFH